MSERLSCRLRGSRSTVAGDSGFALAKMIRVRPEAHPPTGRARAEGKKMSN
jgi:hypothetical protein